MNTKNNYYHYFLICITGLRDNISFNVSSLTKQPPAGIIATDKRISKFLNFIYSSLWTTAGTSGNCDRIELPDSGKWRGLLRAALTLSACWSRSSDKAECKAVCFSRAIDVDLSSGVSWIGWKIFLVLTRLICKVFLLDANISFRCYVWALAKKQV